MTSHRHGPFLKALRAGFVLLCASLALASTGCTAPATLIVELRTDMRPGVEFERVETALYGGTGISALDLPQAVAPFVSLGLSSAAYEGERVAEFADVANGPYLVRVQLLDQRRAVVGTGLAAVELDGVSRVITVLVTRACGGIECPGAGSRPNEIACLAGRCVDPACPEDPTRCPAPDCRQDSECAGGTVDCVEGRCLVGYCVTVSEDDRCGGGVCDLQLGCSGVPSEDAGPVDAGPDAGAGMDGGPEGQDAGPPDAGVDAGPPDAGVDAGPPCTLVPNTTVNISFAPLTSTAPTWSPPESGSCTAATGGQTPYYRETVYCNTRPAPYGFSLEIVDHPTLTDVANPTIWGYEGAGVPTDTTACAWSRSGFGATTPYVLLDTGDYFTVRVGGTMTGAEGALAAQLTP